MMFLKSVRINNLSGVCASGYKIVVWCWGGSGGWVWCSHASVTSVFVQSRSGCHPLLKLLSFNFGNHDKQRRFFFCVDFFFVQSTFILV